MFKLPAFVLPLGLDSFAVAAAIGATQVTTRRARLRISPIFVTFETEMPLADLALGSGLARVAGPVADYVAAAAVIVTGAWMLARRADDEEAAGRVASVRGLARLTSPRAS